MKISENWQKIPYLDYNIYFFYWVQRKKKWSLYGDWKIFGKVILEKVRLTPTRYWLKSWRSFFSESLKNITKFLYKSNNTAKATLPNPMKFSLLKRVPLSHHFAKFQPWGFFRSRVWSRPQDSNPLYTIWNNASKKNKIPDKERLLLSQRKSEIQWLSVQLGFESFKKYASEGPYPDARELSMIFCLVIITFNPLHT